MHKCLQSQMAFPAHCHHCSEWLWWQMDGPLSTLYHLQYANAFHLPPYTTGEPQFGYMVYKHIVVHNPEVIILFLTQLYILSHFYLIRMRIKFSLSAKQRSTHLRYRFTMVRWKFAELNSMWLAQLVKYCLTQVTYSFPIKKNFIKCGMKKGEEGGESSNER